MSEKVELWKFANLRKKTPNRPLSRPPDPRIRDPDPKNFVGFLKLSGIPEKSFPYRPLFNFSGRSYPPPRSGRRALFKTRFSKIAVFGGPFRVFFAKKIFEKK